MMTYASRKWSLISENLLARVSRRYEACSLLNFMMSERGDADPRRVLWKVVSTSRGVGMPTSHREWAAQKTEADQQRRQAVSQRDAKQRAAAEAYAERRALLLADRRIKMAVRHAQIHGIPVNPYLACADVSEAPLRFD
jgi:hypothetical protein